MIPSSVSHEVARSRRFSACLLVVALTASIVAAIREPALGPYLLANAALGMLFGHVSGRDPVPVAGLSRSILVMMVFIFAWNVLRRIFLEPEPANDYDGVWQGFAAVLTGIAVAQLFTARSSIERQQRWWREHGEALALTPAPESSSILQRWRRDAELQARVLTRAKLRAHFTVACVMTVAGVLGVFAGERLSGMLVVLGLLSTLHFGYVLLQRSRRTN